jgi:hypothetical protein
MSDFDDELESLEEREERERRAGNGGDEWTSATDDLEGDAWAERFGVSYVEDRYDAEDIDDDELGRLEEEFFESEDGYRSEFGSMDELNDDWS